MIVGRRPMPPVVVRTRVARMPPKDAIIDAGGGAGAERDLREAYEHQTEHRREGV